MAELRKATESGALKVDVVFAFNGPAESGETFFQRAWPDARAIADVNAGLFRSFELKRAGAAQLLAPSVWTGSVRAFLKGHFVGRPVGDPLLLPGAFLVNGDEVVWEQKAENIADSVDPASVPATSGD